MADPTQAGRDAVKNLLNSFVPEGSPLAQSKSDVLTPEARAKLEAEKAAQSAPASREVAAAPQNVNFVTPQVTPQTPIANQLAQGPAPAFDFNADLPADIKGGLNEQRAAYQAESEIYKQAGAEMAKAEAQYNQEAQAELDAQQKAKDLEVQVSKDVEDRSRQRLEPKNFFAGKNTWQKVMGGLGLFLSSFSKEGAARFAEAVDRDIELDLKAQESAITSKDKAIADKQSLVKQYYDQYKDMRAARLLARADAFSMIKGRAELAASSTKSQAAAGAARQAAGMAEQQAQTAKVAALIQLQKAQQTALTKNSGKMVSVLGFEGMAPTESEAKEFRALGGETKQAIDSIAQLRQLAAKGSSVSPEDRAKAETLSRLLSASLRTTVIGPGAVSDTERAILEKIAANPLDVFSLKASQLTRLGVLENQVKQNLRNKAQIFGLQEAAIGRKGQM